MEGPVRIITDSQTSQAWANNPFVSQSRRRHSDISAMWLSEMVTQQRVAIEWRPRAENLADWATRVTSRKEFEEARNRFLTV